MNLRKVRLRACDCERCVSPTVRTESWLAMPKIKIYRLYYSKPVFILYSTCFYWAPNRGEKKKIYCSVVVFQRPGARCITDGSREQRLLRLKATVISCNAFKLLISFKISKTKRKVGTSNLEESLLFFLVSLWGSVGHSRA